MKKVTDEILSSPGVNQVRNEGDISVASPIDGSQLAQLSSHSASETNRIIARSQQAFLK